MRTACAFKEMAPVRPEWSFKESSTSFTVTAKTKGVSKRNCDVFLSDCFLKINAPPYLLAIDLERAVNEERSKATLTQGQVSIYLHKTSPGLWGKLEAEAHDDEERRALAKRRKASVERVHARIEEQRKQRTANREREKREASDRLLELDRKKRQAIEKAKEDELMSARREISQLSQASGATGSETDVARTGRKSVSWRDDASESEESSSSETENEEYGDGASDTGETVEDGEEDVIDILPPPRETAPAVEVDFTPTIIGNLPAREGREKEIEILRRGVPPVSSDDSTSISERHPVFLKDNGDRMLRMGDLKGAVQAYSHALQIDPTHVKCLSNRSVCFMRMGLYDEAKGDCIRAIALIEEATGDAAWEAAVAEIGEDDAKLLLKLNLRLAKVHSYQGEIRSVISQLELALNLSEHGDEGVVASITRDLSDAKACLAFQEESASAHIQDRDQGTDARSQRYLASMKGIADARFKGGDPKGALQCYNLLRQEAEKRRVGEDADHAPPIVQDEMRALNDVTLASISNGAACELMLGDYKSAIASCDKAVAFLAGLFLPGGHDAFRTHEGDMDLSSKLAKHLSQSSDEYECAKLASLARLLRRKASAFGHLKVYKEAIQTLNQSKTILQSGGERFAAVISEIESDLQVLRSLDV